MLKFLKNTSWIATLEARRRVKDITAILYPDDSTIEGKNCVWFKYFMTSAGQTIIKSYLKMGLPLKDIHEKVSVHINDTHPAVAPAEFMRLLLMNMVFHGEMLGIRLLKLWATLTTLFFKALKMGSTALQTCRSSTCLQIILKSTTVTSLKMAGRYSRMLSNAHVSLRITSPHGELGYHWWSLSQRVAKLHTELLKEDTLHDFYTIYPENSITRQMVSFNVVGHKLQLQNFQQPLMTWLVTVGVTTSMSLKIFTTYLDDKEVLNQFYQVKKTAKQRLADYIKTTRCRSVYRCYLTFKLNVYAYKRQLLNLLLHHQTLLGSKDNPDKDMVPRVFIFGAKVAPWLSLR